MHETGYDQSQRDDDAAKGKPEPILPTCPHHPMYDLPCDACREQYEASQRHNERSSIRARHVARFPVPTRRPHRTARSQP